MPQVYKNTFSKEKQKKSAASNFMQNWLQKPAKKSPEKCPKLPSSSSDVNFDSKSKVLKAEASKQ